jgi:hypothetical protein
MYLFNSQLLLTSTECTNSKTRKKKKRTKKASTNEKLPLIFKKETFLLLKLSKFKINYELN